ncbi:MULTISPECIES: FliM/FliN family flagellar motor switch protein [Sphingomonas]|uniref:FliM/FliN family flagellar motor switch protein n=1 Tax=Sphingomonas TaxID=13687 RepID=UPI0009FE9C7F|nr:MULTISPECIES: FliM/FliN family flagellar motor switch protein [Sphingomonas]
MNQPSPKKTDTATPSGRTLAARMIDDVEVEIEAFVGGTRMTVAELGALKPQSVVTLDAPLNQAVELRLNGVVIGQGELVAVGDKFGVRLSEVAE